MSIKPRTVKDILDEVGEIAVLSICENNVEHAYFGADEITEIDTDILDKRIAACFVVKKSWGFHVSLEV